MRGGRPRRHYSIETERSSCLACLARPQTDRLWGGRPVTGERICMKPPRWSEHLLRSLLLDRDRDTISGDLLEEYRDVAVPTRGAKGGAMVVSPVK